MQTLGWKVSQTSLILFFSPEMLCYCHYANEVHSGGVNTLLFFSIKHIWQRSKFQQWLIGRCQVTHTDTKNCCCLSGHHKNLLQKLIFFEIIFWSKSLAKKKKIFLSFHLLSPGLHMQVKVSKAVLFSSEIYVKKMWYQSGVLADFLGQNLHAKQSFPESYKQTLTVLCNITRDSFLNYLINFNTALYMARISTSLQITS